LKSGLAFWLAVVSTSPAFSHDHPEGDKPHSHGLGFFPTNSASVSANNPHTDIAPETRHSHLVILGVEIHVPPGSPWSAEQDSLVLAPQKFFQLGAEFRNGVETSASTESAAATILEVRASCPAELPRPDVATIWPGSAIIAGTSVLCDLARGLRSGAQQI
jgi:hypothetical protein